MSEILEVIAAVQGIVNASEERIMDRVGEMDTRINGRISRNEKSIGAIERVLARQQGATEEREMKDGRPAGQPPPIHVGHIPILDDPGNGQPSVWARNAVAVLGAFAGVLIAVATILTAIGAWS